MNFPEFSWPWVTGAKQGTGPRFERAGKQFGNPGLEAQFCAECCNGFLRHDRHTIALIFIFEVILFIAGLFIVIGVPQLNALHIGIHVFYMMMLLVAFFHYFGTANETKGAQQSFLMFSMAIHNLLLATYHHPFLAANMPHGYLLAAYLLTIAVYYTFLSAYLAGTTLIAVALGIQYMVLCWWYDSVDLDQAYAFFFLFSLIVFLHYAQLSQARLHRLTWLGSARAKQQQFRAEEIEVFRTQLLNLVGHDLRQPLGALRYYSAAYRIGASNLGADAGARSLLMADQISLALNQITEMLDKALELAQLDNDSVIARCRKQSVAPLVRQLLENFSTAAAVAGVEICIHGSGRVVLHDPALMLPVLRNLVSNVLQYHDHKAARPRVVVAFRGKNSDRIEIIDNGGGIPRHFLENPMQVRRQNETDTRSGLGLTIARHFAVKQGWQMDVVTYPGRGTCLRLHLPSEHVLRDQVSLSETMTRS